MNEYAVQVRLVCGRSGAWELLADWTQIVVANSEGEAADYAGDLYEAVSEFVQSWNPEGTEE